MAKGWGEHYYFIYFLCLSYRIAKLFSFVYQIKEYFLNPKIIIIFLREYDIYYTLFYYKQFQYLNYHIVLPCCHLATLEIQPHEICTFWCLNDTLFFIAYQNEEKRIKLNIYYALLYTLLICKKQYYVHIIYCV